MKAVPGCLCIVLTALVSGCGGGGSGNDINSSAGIAIEPNATYTFTAPALNSEYVFSLDIVDNSSNTISVTERRVVTAVNPDGSYSMHQDDPTAAVNGAAYSITPADLSFDNQGHTLSYAYTSGASQVTCTYTPRWGGPNFPLSIGDTWALDFVDNCSSGIAQAYSAAGTVVGAERITIPAGTFATFKTQSTLSFTNSAGTKTVETITAWRDAGTGHILKSTTRYAYSGTPPANGYRTSETQVLQSQK